MRITRSIAGAVLIVVSAAGCSSIERTPAARAARASAQPVSAPATRPAALATTRAAEVPFVKLWDGRAPGALGDDKSDTPAVQIYLPDAGKGTGSAIVVCPGGGYGGLAPHEAGVVGKWLAGNGIAAFVLRYRLGPKYHH